MKRYKYPSYEGSLSNAEILNLIRDTSSVPGITKEGMRIIVVRCLLTDALIRLGYLLGCDYTVAWDKWGRISEDLVADEVAGVVDRMAQLLRHLWNQTEGCMI